MSGGLDQLGQPNAFAELPSTEITLWFYVHLTYRAEEFAA